ncbi:hypothetical protein LSH36_106g03013 [Paralvinella palmiformis]|uniref:Uncharacterized protein n=1 Tax=Paralvinella palmiformis TaxID=53620 RepID=A0AAD9JZA2_9ANNE|nr:hypothetical protein LSH36_106g03013 [Paralvinella palmiformis]
MEDMPTCRLDVPARKVMIEKLSRAKRIINPTVIVDLCTWKINDEQIYSIIWIQGRVTNVHESGSGFFLDDGTSVAEVDCSNLPAGCPKPELDIYMMVVGELLDIQPHPLVKAIKTQDLSDQSQAQAIWPLEVQDLEKFLTSQQQ